VLYTVHVTAFCLGGRFSGHGVLQKLLRRSFTVYCDDCKLRCKWPSGPFAK